jgi:4-hydroxy-2-oxoheptanedioate aldolase
MTTILEILRGDANLSGICHFTAAPSLIEIAAEVGFDFIMLDTEHAPISLEQAYNLVRVCDAAGISPLVRVSENNPKMILKALESGAEGVVIPQVETREDMMLAMEAALYPPQGSRGSCPSTRAGRYALRNWQEHVVAANATSLVIPLIETPAALDNLAEIVSVEGLKVVYIGPADLSQGLGIPGSSFEHPRMLDILQTLVKLCAACGVHVWTSTGARPSGDYIQMLNDNGVRMLNFSSDEVMFANACKDCIGLFRRPGTAGSDVPGQVDSSGRPAARSSARR